MRDQSVLDIGCGDGTLAFAFWERGASSVTGCDIDSRMIGRAVAEAARRNLAAHFLLANAEYLPFRDRSFDLVTMVTVLAFVGQPLAALREVARVLKPGGRLVIGDLSPWSLWAASRRIRSWLGVAPMWKAASFRSAEELRNLVRAAGLHTEGASGAIYYPRSALIASLIAPLDPWLSELTTFGAAFIALHAAKVG